MADSEKAELTILSEKGQIVIPAKIRSRMRLKPKTKFLVYECDDSVILKKLKEPDLSEELKAMYKRIDQRIAKYGELSNDEINQIIHEHRKKRRSAKVTNNESRVGH
jgi:AbrB family looped-hinge helix DNA binding protein